LVKENAPLPLGENPGYAYEKYPLESIGIDSAWQTGSSRFSHHTVMMTPP